MKEVPDITDLLLTVREFLQKLVPGLNPASQFDAKVAIYLLDIAGRELAASGCRCAGDERSDEVTAKLCDVIRSGACDRVWDETLQSILRETIKRVRVVRPDHIAEDHVEEIARRD